ncbi:hypothetical protein [Streptomyces sp. NPDC005423]|uniref:hypothetical protein n=1 Tax=Streptomyces sp. NPDC005423 TaxID=3155343 RepID=UPI0033A362FD
MFPHADRNGRLELLIRGRTPEELADHRRHLLDDADGPTPARAERDLEPAFERARLVATRQHVDELTVLDNLARRSRTS